MMFIDSCHNDMHTLTLRMGVTGNLSIFSAFLCIQVQMYTNQMVHNTLHSSFFYYVLHTQVFTSLLPFATMIVQLSAMFLTGSGL